MFHRSVCAAVLLAAAAPAATPRLTTIQDVLYKADGRRFNGILIISWSSFQSGDNSQVVTQTTSVKVVDGNLRVQLVPTTTTTPAVYYNVVYNSDGRIQFKETWAVPASTQSVRVRDVRVSSSSDTAGGTGGAAIAESDVVGLVSDLGSRPLKGAGYAAGRVAVINANGELEAASGALSECVRVDGSSGPCGADTLSFVDGEIPSGIVDGANTSFTLAGVPDPATSVAVYRNGLLQKIDQDFTLSSRTLQFTATAIPQPADTLLASYRIGGAGESSGTGQMYPSPQVLCSGTGSATTATTMSSIGACSIPSGLLQAGDRVEAHFDVEHAGTISGFSFELRWGETALGHMEAGAAESLVTGRMVAGVVAAGARLSYQSWGTVLPFAAGVASAADGYTGGLTLDFQGKLGQAGDTLRLGNFTVVRYR